MQITILDAAGEILPRGNRNFRPGKETETAAILAAASRAGRKAATAQLHDVNKLYRNVALVWKNGKVSVKGDGAPKGPGVISTLINTLQEGKKLSVEDLTAKVASATGHAPEKVGKTVRTQLSRLAVNGVLAVRSERVGRTCVYWA